jgi:HlyD family secretion protein
MVVFGLVLTPGLLAAVVAVATVVRTPGASQIASTATVRRVDIDSVVVAPGRLVSAQSTEVRCTLERLSTGSAATILSLIDDGTMVKQGQVVCELDSSSYQELVRRQSIAVDQARASFRQAELNLEVARINLEAFRQGEMRQAEQIFRGQLALARSDLARQKDRLGWSRRMIDKGYVSASQLLGEQLSLDRVALTMKQVETAFENYQRFSAPIRVRSLEGDINGAKATYDFEDVRLRREEERLALYQSMVDRCTVRAPHDGLVIHANRQGRAPEVLVGATVRQRQPLFALPDLTRIEVEAMFHETVVSRIKVGMPARIRVEALPDIILKGVVVSVAPLPFAERKAESGSEVTYFVGRVQIAKIPERMRPGMTAELEVLTGHRKGVLAIPRKAIFADGIREGCYVARPDHLEPRTVTVGMESYDLAEVIDGLVEGEKVVLPTP